MELKEIAHTIIGQFEMLLNKKDITIPSDDREGNEDEARIFGKEYYDLEDKIENILKGMKTKVLIVELKGYIGNDTDLRVIPDPLFMVVDAETGEDLDNGYRSFDEAVRAWYDHDIVNREVNKE